MERIVEGDIPHAHLTPEEQAIAALVQKSVVAPARLEPVDLRDLVTHFGVSGSLEIVAVLSEFHLVNRIADLVGIRSDLPLIQQHWRRLRWWGIRLAAWITRHMVDLRNQEVEVDIAAALAAAETVLGPLPAGYQAIHQAPNVAGYLLSITRVVQQLPPQMLDRVTQGVANALPSSEAEVTGFHASPMDPVDALVFVGTRYAVRTTAAMVTAIRDTYGYGDPELTDLFYAIAMRNGLERMQRLLAAMPSSI